MKMVVIERAFQGTAGSRLFQLVNNTIYDLLSLRKRDFYMGLIILTWAIAGGVGLVLGGIFNQYLTWCFIFWINLPIAGAAFLRLFSLDVHKPRSPLRTGLKAMDWTDTIAILGLMIMLLLWLDFGSQMMQWSSSRFVGLIVVGCVVGGLF